MNKSALDHIRVASDRASTNPEVATAHALAAIAILLAFPALEVPVG